MKVVRFIIKYNNVHTCKAMKESSYTVDAGYKNIVWIAYNVLIFGMPLV